MHARALLIRSFLGALLATGYASVAHGAAPQLFRTQNYQTPVRAAPDDLLFIAGDGFRDGDRVVYQAADEETGVANRPRTVPIRNTADSGTAEIVHVTEPAITVHLPQAMRAYTIYKLWVVTARNEWSEPISINDPRPLWFTPSFAYATAEVAQLGRRLRVIGRNLEPAVTGGNVQIRLRGRSTYVLKAEATRDALSSLQEYVAEAPLPARVETGRYTVSVSRDGLPWVDVPEQELLIQPDPAAPPTFELDDDRFGNCKPNDDTDDSPCLIRAISAARAANGGTIKIGAGTWHIAITREQAVGRGDGIVLPPNVNLRGAGVESTKLIRTNPQDASLLAPMLTVSGHNTITGITFAESFPFSNDREGQRPTINVGTLWSRASTTAAGVAPATVDDVIITGNRFQRVGRALVSAGRPINRLFVTHNEFAAYHTDWVLTGDRANITQPFRTDDSVFRFNTFVPGSHIDIGAHQGTIATGLGAATRVDFSSNFADGTRLDGLQKPGDQPGFRAAFFWNVENNNEQMLVAQNRVLCSGDKAGDGEAVSLDGNGLTFPFKGWPKVTATGRDTVTVKGDMLTQQLGHTVPTTYYRGHWVTLVEGRGLGQSRRVVDYTVNAAAGTVTFRISPAWDVAPAVGETRVLVTRQFWQTYIVANDIDQGNPPCRKSNLTDKKGGSIVLWSPSADTVIAGNHQRETTGIWFSQGYSAKTPSCPSCGDGGSSQAGLEIRDNVIDGEYDYSSDCSDSGIYGGFGASPTPEFPPPISSFGIVIAHNEITQADALYGGAIDITAAWHRGPPPGRWSLVQNPLIFNNVIRNVNGSPPRNNCKRFQRARIGIRLDGPGNVSDAVLYGNECDRVDRNVEDGATRTQRVCPDNSSVPCECGPRPRPPASPKAQSPD